LKRYIQSNCNSGVRQVPLSELRGSKIAVDVSIYMYRYKINTELMEGMYSMIHALQKNGLSPVFVFDGKPKPNKDAEISKRRQQKNEAWEQYKTEDQKDTTTMSGRERYDHQSTLKELRSRCVRIVPDDTSRVKLLIEHMGSTWLDAPHEADELCAKLVKTRQVYAVLSEDMDMFVYGCAHILRYLSIVHETVLVYDLKVVLKELAMSHDEFKQVCVISGTDYYNPSRRTIFFFMDLFRRYQRCKRQGKSSDFYEWIMEKHSQIITSHTELLQTYFMFDLQSREYDYLNAFSKVPIVSREPRMDKLEELLEPEGFIFACQN
jgi:hypothetical protein